MFVALVGLLFAALFRLKPKASSSSAVESPEIGSEYMAVERTKVPLLSTSRAAGIGDGDETEWFASRSAASTARPIQELPSIGDPIPESEDRDQRLEEADALIERSRRRPLTEDEDDGTDTDPPAAHGYSNKPGELPPLSDSETETL